MLNLTVSFSKLMLLATHRGSTYWDQGPDKTRNRVVFFASIIRYYLRLPPDDGELSP